MDSDSIFEAIKLLNDSPQFLYMLGQNCRTNKWNVYRLDREQNTEGVWITKTARIFSAGDTPRLAVADALKLRLAPEPSLPDAISRG